MSHTTGRACRVALIAVLFAAMFLHLSPRARAQNTPHALDLAALTLAPADVGEPGFLHAGAFVQPLDDWAANLAAYRGDDTADVRERLVDAGWERKYVSILRQPMNDAAATYAQAVMTYVTEFRDDAGAFDAFTYTEDESAIATAVDLPSSQTIGEQSEITREAGVSGTTGQPFASLDLAFQLGRFHAGVTLYRYEPTAAAPATPIATPVSPPDTAMVERLAAIVAERLTNPGDAPDLGLKVLRFAGDDTAYTTYDDAYYRLNGVNVPVLAESDEPAAARVASYGDATDVYQLWQGIDVGGADGLLYAATVFRFPSTADAAEWVSNAPASLARNPSYRRIEPIDADTQFGDQSRILTFTPRGSNTSVSGAMVIARVESLVVRVQLAPSGNRVIDLQPAVVELAVRQVECVRTGECGPPTLPDV